MQKRKQLESLQPLPQNGFKISKIFSVVAF